ncbi:MAG: hypothetical protein IPH44_33170 [Myxococcales bacterium]|jgi:hypothetical protein|nr:hypothetical protein [Myxococcales bacterium]
MSNESTTTSLASLTHASLVQPVLIKALSEKSGLYRYARQFDLRSQATAAAKIPTQTAWWGTPADHGAAIDTELNATEGQALGNTQQSASSVTVTATEFGVQMAVTDQVAEQSLSGIDVMGAISGSMLSAMLLAWESDYLTLASSLSNSVGTTNTTATIAIMVSAQTGLRTRGVDADAIAYILDNVAGNAIETAFTATNAAAAVYSFAADRILAWNPANDNGMGGNRQIATFRGYPVTTTGLTITANSAVDANSMCVCPSTAYNDASGATTHAMAIKRLPRLRSDASSATAIGSRSTIMVLDSMVGFGEIQDGAGTYILAKAT